jgi:phage baseplate assembly protein W
MPEFQTFKDFNLNFKPHPVTEDLQVVKDGADIKQSIKSLLLTRRGERLFNSDLGTGLSDLLFEPLDFGTAALIRDEIYEVIGTYESRIDILELNVDINFEDNGYDIALEYVIRGREDLQTNIEFFLESSR